MGTKEIVDRLRTVAMFSSDVDRWIAAAAHVEKLDVQLLRAMNLIGEALDAPERMDDGHKALLDVAQASVWLEECERALGNSL